MTMSSRASSRSRGTAWTRKFPILVDPELARTRFFQEIIARGTLAGRNWVPHDTLFRIDRLIVPVHGSFHEDTPVRLQRLLGSGPLPGDRRIFLTRGKNRKRSLANEDEIASQLSGSYGFEVVDAETLSVEEQILLFGSASVVVAVHGAGLTNMLHRAGADARIVELFPSDFIHVQFAWLSRAAGFEWRAVVGSPLQSSSGTFRIPLAPVLQAIGGSEPESDRSTGDR